MKTLWQILPLVIVITTTLSQDIINFSEDIDAPFLSEKRLDVREGTKLVKDKYMEYLPEINF